MSKPRLLLADDSATIQKVVNLTFEDEGIEVIGVGDGDTAMQRFSEIHPDIVLADVNMPGLSGYQICENIRQNQDTRETPVILLVGSFEPFDEDEARRVGATDVLTKPFQSIRQLVIKVTELLPKHEQAGEVPDENNAPVLEVPGASAETPSETPVEQDLGEIDNLYRESFAETVEMPHIPDETLEMPHVHAEPQALGDVSMDDEMIETSLPESSVADTTREYNFSDREDLGFASVSPPGQAEPIYQAEEVASPFDSVAEEAVFEPDAETEYAREDYRDNEPEPQHFDDEGNLLELSFPEDAPPPYSREAAQPPETGTAGFSQEFIDAIAQRVSEKITQNIIREIAWEVVPVIAESVIREKTGGQH